jgi:hypothetical protein
MEIGSVEQFKPKMFGTKGASKLLFLEKSSGGGDQQLILSPFSEILIHNPALFTSNNWFKDFFQQIRVTQVMTDKQAEDHIVNDVYRSIRDLDVEASKQGMQGINEHGFTEEEIASLIDRINKIGDTDIQNKKEKNLKRNIRRFLKGETGLGKSYKDKKKAYKTTQMTFLQESFTPTEVVAFTQDWEDLKELLEEDGLEDYKIEWYKDGRNLAGMLPKRDKEGKKMKDSKGNLIMEYQDGGGIEGGYGIITLIYDDNETSKYTPQQAYENDLKIKATTIRESTKQVREEAITEMEEELKRLQDKREKLAEEGDKKPQLKELDNQINSLREDISSSQESKITPKDLKEAIQNFREGHAQEDFTAFLVNTAYKLKDSGGLKGLSNVLPTSSKSSKDKISAEMALIYLSSMATQAGRSEVVEAFKKIDAALESGEAEKEAKALNDKMPNILETIVSVITTAFEKVLTDYVTNPAEFSKYNILPASKAFLEHKLIKVGE